MIVKIIRFTDCRAIITDEKINVPGTICRCAPHIEMLPKEPILDFNCREEVFSDVCHNKQLFQKLIDAYMVKEITTTDLQQLLKNKQKWQTKDLC